MIDPHAKLKYARLRYMQRLAIALLGAMLVLSALFKTAIRGCNGCRRSPPRPPSALLLAISFTF